MGQRGLLYAANFNSGKVDVFYNAFHPVTVPGGFVDPNLPFGYAPFNVQNLNGNIYVTYALRNSETLYFAMTSCSINQKNLNYF